MTTPGTTARKRRSGASLYTTLARFVCLRKSCFRRVDGGGGRMTEEGFRPPPAGAKRDPGGGVEKPRSKWLEGEEGYGWINTITQGWLAAATRSPVPAWRNTRAERNGRNGRDITTPLLVIEIIRCLDTRPRLRLPSFSSSPLFFSFCLSVDPSPYILATADKTADGRV